MSIFLVVSTHFYENIAVMLLSRIDRDSTIKKTTYQNGYVLSMDRRYQAPYGGDRLKRFDSRLKNIEPDWQGIKTRYGRWWRSIMMSMLKRY